MNSENVGESTQVAGPSSPVQLRWSVHPPKRLTYDKLGESSDKLIHTIRTVPEAAPPIVNWVGSDSARTSDTRGWDTAIALACSQTECELSKNVYRWLLMNPEVGQSLLDLDLG